ncbi:hypothetical protein HHK36_010024 [Tetracentron sinense]|uniref:K Homology domain-containing protein n=1 Tax=Tetracentron sinense TaxID=13715 RepID=A0A834ZK22_TETSI|nr:hypothetical protein HHK36_010024 [Tetracentron sinense]
MGEEESQLRPETTDNSKRKLEEIQLAKQKAQEIVARLVNDAEAKRPRLEDSSEPESTDSVPYPPFPDGLHPSSYSLTFTCFGGPVKIFHHPLSVLIILFSSLHPDPAQKPSGQLTPNSGVGSVPFSAYPGQYHGFQGTSKRIDIPNGKVGVIIGKGGETIKYLQLQSGAKIQVTKDTEADPYSQTRGVDLSGTPEQISRAEQLVKDVIAETDSGGSGSSGNRGSMQPGAEQFTMKVPNNKVALLIGKGGETIKNMQTKSGARIQIIPLHLPPGDTSTERTVHINGTKEQIELAKELINEVVVSEIRVRNPSLPSNYTQQGYRPPGNWGPPGAPPMQQPGYGYTQPGTYPTAPPPYYGNYPSQPASWDQSNQSGVPTSQQSTGYNYYGQQAQTESTPQNASYSYGQVPPATSQSYDQGYSQQPQSYGQDASSQAPQQDQQKPYATPGYGPPSQLDGTTPSQPYGTQSSSQPPNSYPYAYSQPLAAPQSGYGSSQSYTGPPPSQPGYDQSGYAQTGYGEQQQAQIPPTTSQPQYGQGGYPPQPAPVQPSYAQGINPPVYGQPPSSTHGYLQPLAYGAEGTSNGNSAPSYGSAPAVQEAVHPQS